MADFDPKPAHFLKIQRQKSDLLGMERLHKFLGFYPLTSKSIPILLMVLCSFSTACSSKKKGSTNSTNLTNAYATPTPTPFPVETPTGLAALAQNNSVTLTWSAVSDATSYTLSRSTVAGSGYQEIASGIATQTYTDSNLPFGPTYYYQVKAVNEKGWSEKSLEAHVLPIAPSIIDSIVINDSVGGSALLVNWSESPGAIHYSVRFSTVSGQAASGPEGCTPSTEPYSCIIRGLSAGTPTYLSVVASNTDGGGASSTSSELSGTPLAAFNLLTSTPTSKSTSVVNWEGSDGATSYVLKYGTTPGDYPTLVSENASKPATVSGLSEDTTYYYMVTAKNSNGALNAIAEVSAKQPKNASAPILSRALTQAARIDLSWSPGSGTPPITYTVKRSTTSGSGYAPLAGCTSLATLVCNDSSATPGTLYYYVVNATNPGGSSDSNEVSGKSMSAFSITSSTQTGAGQASIVFGSSAGASTYKVKFGNTSGNYSNLVSSSATSPTLLTGLWSATNYFVMVYAVNASGEIPASAESPLVTLATPSAPTGLTSTNGVSNVKLSWTAPNGPGTLTYSVLRGTAAGGPYSSLASGLTSTTYTDLTALNGTLYYYVVQASNLSGPSPNSAETQGRPIALPAISAVVASATYGAGALNVSWSASTGASNYTVKYSTTSGQAKSGTSGCTSTGTNCTINVTAGYVYYLSLNASSTLGGGASVDSAEVQGISIGTPTITLTPGGNRITPTFSTPGATSYELAYRSASGGLSVSHSSYTSGTPVTDLTNGMVYYFTLTAKNNYGSQVSAETSATPNGPTPFSITSTTPLDGSITLAWGASTGATGYTIKYGTTSGTYPNTSSASASPATVSGLTNSTRYYFMVTATNANGSQNANSEVSEVPIPLPLLSLSPLTAAMGSVSVSLSSSPTSFTFSNTGHAPATGCSTTLSNTTDFSMVDGCGTSLSDGASCAISVKANPTTIGAKTATLSRTCTFGGTASTTANGITTTGIKSILAWSPLVNDFGSVYVNSNSMVKTFTFSNTGTGPATGCSAPTLVDNNPNFNILEDKCGINELAVSSSCTVTVRANPQSTGVKTTSLTRTCSLGGVTNSTANGISENGIANAPILAFTDSTLSFGAVNVGKSSSLMMISLMNSGPGAATGCQSPTLSNGYDFQIGYDTCQAKDLAAGSACEIGIWATPASVGTKATTLSRYCSNGGSISTTANGLTTVGNATALTTVTQFVSSGNSNHTCARMSDGSVMCWGYNSQGQLGDATTISRANPVLVPVSNVSEVTTGGSHTCALLSDASVKCWGLNNYGQLGDGTTTNKTAPTTVPGLSAKSISAGANHTCAVLLADNTIKCWGYNANAQLGDNTKTNRSNPTAVSSITNASVVTASINHTCALLIDKSIKCWGLNTSGELGDGTLIQRQTPVAVFGITDAVSLSSGLSHNCAILTGGTVQCWGLNTSGQLGDASVTNRNKPVAVYGLTGAVSIATGANHSCVRNSAGVLSCWGSNTAGQLYDGYGGTNNSTTPISAQTSPWGATALLTAGAAHTCIVNPTGITVCFGSNAYSQLGDGSVSSKRPIPFDPGMGGVTSITSGFQFSCALMFDRNVRCWGANGSGQLGDGTTYYRPSPVQSGPPYGQVTSVVAGYTHTCMLLTNGTVQCYGDNTSGQRGTTTPDAAVNNISGVTAIAAGRSHNCALLSDKTIRCWGLNSSSQLGNGNTTAQTTPINPGVTGVVGMALGETHTCVVIDDGTVKCWGGNTYGQIGDGSTTTRSTPVAISGLTNVSSVVAGVYHTCALLTNSSIKCWGLNGSGQLGNGVTTNATTPTFVSGISNATALMAGNGHTCASLSDKSLKCWGLNSVSQLGDRTLTNRILPVYAYLPGLVAKVSQGYTGTHTCVVMTTGTASCWGNNDSSQAGYDESQPRYVGGFF